MLETADLLDLFLQYLKNDLVSYSLSHQSNK